jgi:subtilisin family serine protease
VKPAVIGRVDFLGKPGGQMNQLTIAVSFVIMLVAQPTLVAAQVQRPNDPYFDRQVSFVAPGGLVSFDATAARSSPIQLQTVTVVDLNILNAWAITTGSRDVVVAIIDDGFPYWHEDLRDNTWRNPGESGPDESGYPKESNGRDDDQNGYVDDVMGFDFVFSDPDPDPYIFHGRRDDKIAVYRHGVAAVGIIGARGNNGVGVAGVNWQVSLMLLKIGAQGTALDPDGQRRVEWAAEAIRYAVDNGARVINWSGSVRPTEPEQLALLTEALEYAERAQVLVIVAAGNDKEDLDLPENCRYPQCLDLENLVLVGEIDFDGSLYVVPDDDLYVGGSNYGARRVDIAALAQNYTTDVRENVATYRICGGTSCAAPVVTGVAALIWSVRPDLGGSDVKEILIRSARRLPELSGRLVGEGMVDAEAALRMAVEFEH